jgi:hypothetical protein
LAVNIFFVSYGYLPSASKRMSKWGIRWIC